jgi:hypothetical protein
MSNGGSILEVPVGKGLLLSLQADGKKILLEVVDDQHYPDIHPNCYAPADCTKLQLLRGGGSGTAVFAGEHPKLGSIVMKHAGYKDSQQVFALALISQELHRRGGQEVVGGGGPQSKNVTIAADMKRRIPVFVMAYLSCYHLRDRSKELWSKLRTVSYSLSGQRTCTPKAAGTADWNGLPLPLKDSNWKIPNIPVRESFSDPRVARRIRVLYPADDDEDSRRWSVGLTYVDIFIPFQTIDGQIIVSDPSFIEHFAMEVGNQLEVNKWKMTLAQQRIGGANATNGADILAACQLKGPLLDTLVQEFVLVMKHLYDLTDARERVEGLAQAQHDFQSISQAKDVTLLTEELDSFVGGAIIKNFHPEHGRFCTIRVIGADMRKETLFLTPGEITPSKFLGQMLEASCCFNEIFSDDLRDLRSAMNQMEERGWWRVLDDALQFSADESAGQSIWTCGLTDAGLHNTFLCLERGLEIFDLGEPGLQSQPAFLTKFLMSFYHTLGMESDSDGVWYKRFDVVQHGQSLRMKTTAATDEKLACAEQSFLHALDRIVSEVFDGDVRVRNLLVQYVVLQLLSDSSFCLQRWESKGGGVQRYGERLKDPLEQWLWRSIWDQYVASVVFSSFLVKE